ncbi:BTAD domain-containing putative transcriptional regulator [Actinoplanes sp. NPDC051411]|uniref:AfsR/SARP family transcriptional regulator n=1 Tax=Actinoplanes sp. NPDC051411 TaxID=3155522 RepID=UPI003447A157
MPEASFTFRVLGPVRLELPGGTVHLGPGKQVCLFACLLLDAGRIVAAETLIDRIWGTDPPRRARNLLATYATRLRSLLPAEAGPVTVRYVAGGYVAELDRDRVDLHAARRMAATTDEGLLRRALDLWEPVALAGVPGEWAQRTRDALHDERLDLLTRWADAALEKGDPRPVVEQLRPAAEDAPYHEGLHARLVRALAADGQRAAAMAAYREIADRLGNELGVEPGEALSAAYGEMRGAGTGAVSVSGHRPAQLPSDPADFTGRGEQLALLDELAPVNVIFGAAGAGKTALAVHWGHSVRSRFADGQLFVNLRGFDPSSEPLSPAVALHGFLTALDVPASRIPVLQADRSALFRSLLADRRMLIVLDNARSAAQVRPLLPGGSGCSVVVTSRDPLTPLITTEQARSLRLALFPYAEARGFLVRRLGAVRVNAAPAAADELIGRASGLPLALSIAAARAAVEPDVPLARIARSLRTLDDLRGGDAASDLRTVFSSSYRTLAPAGARMFRLLGLHPIPQMSLAAAASLAGVPPDAASALLASLEKVNLISVADGVVTLHDLLHAYAASLAGSDPAAWDRLASHYLQTAVAADLLLDPARPPVPLPPPVPGSTPDRPHDAMDWFTRWHQALLAMLRSSVVVPLAYHLTIYLQRQGHWTDQVVSQEAALAASTDPAPRARALRALARALIQLGRYPEAGTRLRAAAETAVDRRTQANIHLDLAWLLDRQGLASDARDEARRALALGEGTDVYPYALNAVGWYAALLGLLPEALARCRDALAAFAARGDQRGEAESRDSLGYIQLRLGEPAAAVRHFEAAIALYRELGDRHGEGETLARLGDAHAAAGSPSLATGAWQRAADTLTSIGHPSAASVRAKLWG